MTDAEKTTILLAMSPRLARVVRNALVPLVEGAPAGDDLTEDELAAVRASIEELNSQLGSTS